MVVEEQELQSATATVERLEQFGRAVRHFRVERGLSQAAVARAAGVDRKTINRVENARFAPHLDHVFAIADALGVRPEELFAARIG